MQRLPYEYMIDKLKIWTFKQYHILMGNDYRLPMHFLRLPGCIMIYESPHTTYTVEACVYVRAVVDQLLDQTRCSRIPGDPLHVGVVTLGLA